LVAGVFLGAPADGEELVATPPYRAEVVVSGMAFVTDVIEPSRDVLYVAVGASSPGGRLIRFTVPEGAHAPLAASRSVQLWSRDRLSPIVAYKFSIRVHAGVPDPWPLAVFCESRRTAESSI
jgi:hypothetical protein